MTYWILNVFATCFLNEIKSGWTILSSNRIMSRVHFFSARLLFFFLSFCVDQNIIGQFYLFAWCLSVIHVFSSLVVRLIVYFSDQSFKQTCRYCTAYLYDVFLCIPTIWHYYVDSIFLFCFQSLSFYHSAFTLCWGIFSVAQRMVFLCSAFIWSFWYYTFSPYSVLVSFYPHVFPFLF